MSRVVHRYKSRLDDLFKKVTSVDDLELQAHWARYLCVLVSGFIEIAIKEILDDYAARRASPEISNYVSRELRKETNLKMNKIIRLLSQFNGDWGEELERQTEGELKDAIDSIVANRHRIAHGQDTGVSFLQVKRWYEKTKDVVYAISEMLSR
ncbi:MAG TPA: hypothetical protein ENG51_14575 [Deltaproteobacteria bacterium]|nr:hypothetical protein [Deltaproteobacteria bacterium]